MPASLLQSEAGGMLERSYSLVLALIRQRRRKVERLVAGATERGVGRCGHLPARNAREQEERRRYGAQAQHSTAMHDILSHRSASVVPTDLRRLNQRPLPLSRRA